SAVARVARTGLAPGAGAPTVELFADEDVQALGRADAIENDGARLVLPAAEDFGRQRLASRDAGADAARIARLGVERHQQGCIERRHAVVERRLEALDVLEGDVGRRPAGIEDRRAAGPP